MNAEKLEKIPPPPGIIASLRSGFDIVSTHVALIIPPILLDVFLWLGTRVSAGKLYSSLVTGVIETLKSRPVPADQIKSLSDSVDVFSRFNWLSWIRTFPVGIPSLDAFAIRADSATRTPLGIIEVTSLDSVWALLALTGVLILAGWVCGSIYFRWVAITVLGESDAKIGIVRAVVQTVVLSVIWMVCLITIVMPIVVVVSLVGYFNVTLANGLLFIILFFSYWLIIPFFFMPHGIFARRQNALYSLYSSLRMTRFTLPTSGLFVFTSFLLAEGLNFLWNVPESDSWVRLVGIAGHAFISTTLLAASFVFYRDMNVWLQTVFAQMQQKQSLPTQQA